MRQILLLSLLLIVSSCVPDDSFKINSDYVPEQLSDGWEVTSPDSFGISASVLEEINAHIISEDEFFNAKSLLIIKEGHLVFESYVRDPADRDRYGHVQSATKSINSLITGIVFSEGYLDSLDQKLYNLIPHDKFPANDDKKNITLRHLMTMKSGLNFDNDDFSMEIYVGKPEDPIRYILNKDLYDQPGESFYYRDCDPHLLSYTIGYVTGKSLEDWAVQRLFSPLGISDYYWDSDPTGTSMGGHGVHVRPRDLAKIGQLVLDNGKWNGIQVVDSTWIAQSTSLQTDMGDWGEENGWEYGHYWWLIPEWNAFAAWGHGGNFIFIKPDQELVIIMTALPDTNDEMVGTTLDKFQELIRPLIES
ncbi:MAG: serine hydrolase [Candidatus Marinimicrobia bacterium]|nr:serine hydrolase [Candidatus Neomarinimicrobiota bacterium]